MCAAPPQVGTSDDEELAARLRDLAVLAMSSSSHPRLNFDADEYSLSEVSLLLQTLAQESPRTWSMNLLAHALTNAIKHGVRHDMPEYVVAGKRATHHKDGTPIHQQPQGDGRTQDEAALLALSQHGKAARAAGAGAARAGGEDSDEVMANALGAGEEEEEGVSAAMEVDGASDEEGGGDYVRARITVVPRVRLHLLVDPSPSAHRPLVRAHVQVRCSVRGSSFRKRCMNALSSTD